uniref:Uncharacterized protein n=1 Tax=Myoviridae sp. ctaOv25 TaxID=2827290 RepID=A0A8S5R6B3_9CAUD|nr:MAG TPA: hypothetical protein [Myoviridae sp. ctaOv25]
MYLVRTLTFQFSFFMSFAFLSYLCCNEKI